MGPAVPLTEAYPASSDAGWMFLVGCALMLLACVLFLLAVIRDPDPPEDDEGLECGE